MAELMRLESSKFESNQLGCMWGLVQYFDFHQRLHRRKMLAYRKNGDDKQSRGTRIATSKENALTLLEGETNSQMENDVNVASRSFGKSLMRTLLHRKMSKKRDKGRKISPSASQLPRTISIHHLECNDYVLPDETASDSESSAVELNSQETDSSASSEHMMLLPRGPDGTIFGKQYEARETMDTTAVLMEKLIEVKEALIKQKDTDANVAPQLNDLLDKIELFNTNRNSFLEVLQDPSSELVKNLLALQTSNGTLGLIKSASFPETKLLGRRGRKSILKHKLKMSNSFTNSEVKSQAGNSNTIQDDLQVVVPMAGANAGNLKLGSASVNTAGVASRNGKTVLSRWKDFKQRIKDVVKDNRKEHRRISMDGVLHKVPVGQKLPEPLEKEKFGDIARIKLGVDGPNYGNRKFARRSVQRSRSLTESMDRYSYLLESISVKESKRFPESLKPIQEDAGLQERKLPKTFGRIFSTPEFRMHSFGKDFESEVSDAALFSEKPASNLLFGDEAVVTNGSDEPKPVGILLNREGGMKSDKLNILSTIEVNANDENLQQTVLVDEHEQSRICVVSDDLMTGDSNYVAHDQGNEVEVDPTNKPTKPSPVSLLGSHFQEDPVSPTKYAVSEGGELQSNWIHFEELEALAKPQDQLSDSDSQGLELVEFDEEQILKDTNDASSFNVHVDREEEAEFYYVRDVLRKSGLIGGAEGLGTWLSPYQTEVDSLLFGDAEGSPLELETTLNESLNVPLYRQLLFDLMNEVLLEIYESCVAQSTSFLQFDRRIRPIPVGNHVIEEVWAKIRWHISTQRHLNPTLDYYVARDLAKDDEWMNLHWDSEYIGVKLECLILDNLLDDIIRDFGVI